MSNIREKIEEVKKAAKKSRRINNILWFFVVGLVGLAFYLAYIASMATERAIEQEHIALYTATRNDSLMTVAVDSKEKILAIIEEADSDLWEQAKKANSVDSYSFYLKVTEGKKRNEEVQKAISELFQDEGYVQLVDSNGRTKFFEEKVKSNLGDFYVALQDRNVNTGVIGHSDFPTAGDKRGFSIKKGQAVKVLQEFQSGNSLWAKIGFKNR